ncbi:MAG TPA: phosphotransferase [Thermoanaerobaculia bacterium]|jgi:hypothetical protein|nr:phosphotransferase [Thermoanaerobaculia bacterium]
MKFRQIDRFIVDVDSPAAVRYFNRSLRVPWSHAARLLTRFPALTRFLGSPASAQDVPIVITDYPDSRRRRTIKLLPPASVIKIRELPADGPSLAIEAEACERVHALLQRSTPRVIRFEQTSEAEVLVLTALPGVSAYVAMQQAFAPSRLAERHFEAAARWLTDFRRVLPNASHGDFWAQNLLITEGGEAGVVDWERFESEGSPDADLFHFPLTYGLNFRWRRGATDEEKFTSTFLERNRVSLAVRNYLRRFGATSSGFLKFLEGRHPKLAAVFSRANESVFSG